jgi:hypothetical protein
MIGQLIGRDGIRGSAFQSFDILPVMRQLIESPRLERFASFQHQIAMRRPWKIVGTLVEK